MGGPVQPGDFPEPKALGLKALFNLYVIFNVDEFRRHDLPPTHVDVWDGLGNWARKNI